MAFIGVLGLRVQWDIKNGQRARHAFHLCLSKFDTTGEELWDQLFGEGIASKS